MNKKKSKKISQEIKDINSALAFFPKIVREQKRAHYKSEETIKRFMGMAKKLSLGKLKVEKP